MTNKAVKYGIVGIAVVLFVAVAFAGAVSAGDISIANADEWIWNVSNGTFAGMSAGETIYLTGDLDFSGKDQSKIVISSFVGNLDGYDNGVYHTICNFSISGDSSFGLFDSLSGSKISNITIENFIVTGSGGDVGVLVGMQLGSCTFENLIVRNGEVTASGTNVGGVIGKCDGPIVFKNITVMNNIIYGSGCVGGLVGYGFANSISVTDCYVRCCDISEGSYLGGIVGHLSSGTANFVNCFVECCSVSGVDNLGGIVGYTGGCKVSVTASNIKDCVIDSGWYVGGLVGYVYVESPLLTLDDCIVDNCVIKSYQASAGGCLSCVESKNEYVRTVDNCTVRNCAIYTSAGNSPCGGIIGKYIDYTPTVYPSVSNCTVEFCTIAGQGSGNLVGGISGMFPVGGTLVRNKVISSCIVSVSGKAAGICPTAITTS